MKSIVSRLFYWLRSNLKTGNDRKEFKELPDQDAAFEKQRSEHWRILKIAEKRILTWLLTDHASNDVFAIHFIPHRFKLEALVFYKNDDGVIRNQQSGISQAIEAKLLKELTDMKYEDLSKTTIQCIFDSDENVRKNYEGSYFYRLR